MPVERLENLLGRDGEEFVRAVRDAVAVVPHVIFERIRIEMEMVEDGSRVRVTLPTTTRGYRKVFHVSRPLGLRRSLERYLRKKYGVPA